jgi:transcription antitermination factor NusG
MTMTPPQIVPRWYAIRTRSRHEKLVAFQLQEQGIETFLPTVTRIHRWSDRKKQVELPLFSGYAFTRLALASDERLRVLRTQGVVDFVSMHGAAIPIPDNEIADIRNLLNSKVPFRDRPFLRLGQRVRIRGGALDGLEGILVAESGDHSLVISVTPIQRSLSIRLDGYDVEPI